MSGFKSPTDIIASTPIRVLMVVQSLPPLPSGGAEIQAFNLARVLVQKGIKVTFITPGVYRIKGYEEKNGIAIYRLHSFLSYFLDLLFFLQKKKPSPATAIEFDDSRSSHNTISRKIGIGAILRYRSFLFNATRFLKKRISDFDIIHSHTIEWPGYVSAELSKRFGKKLFVKDSTMNGIFNILRFPDGKEKQRLIINQAHFVAMTRMIESNLLTAGVQPEKISRIPNGIDTDGAFKTKYKAGHRVLFIGNLYQQPAKGVDILLKAWVIIVAEIPAAKLEIAGDGDLTAYRNYTTTLGINDSVLFHGKHNNIDSLLLETDVFVLPSRREGMPNVLMEAMLKAVPCVATDISGSQDLIAHEQNGLLVPPANVTALANNIINLLKNPVLAEKLGRNARETILESYSMRQVADEYIKLYKK